MHELAELRGRARVFRDRSHAGEILAGMLTALRGSDARVLAIPAGGIPVAAPLADALGLPLGAAVVSKITLPWNSEVGYGAIAFDGTVLLNEDLLRHLGLGKREVSRGIAETREKVARRVRSLRGAAVASELAGGSAVLVDDGLASGFTMRAAIEAVRKAGAQRVAIAVPTGSPRTAERLTALADELFCANLRGGLHFAVADAYEHWTDVPEAQAAALLARHREKRVRTSFEN